ncbi:heparinase II/III family protein [Cyclobacterium xiamenense]|uniref:heparinase II/III family protein n=1 Tax=Cyclobacterium xiamenense TaxID=1297121 RepID=UPI0012B9C80A|nr:heparinase II/III family protein [Cyclobacterium xiamenense]
MTKVPKNRREFLKQASVWSMGMYLGEPLFSERMPRIPHGSPADPLLDWSDWKKYRTSVQHPCLTIKEQNVANAKENIRKYDWAKVHGTRIQDVIENHVGLITDDFLEMMIEETTPGDPLWTPCPSCREKGMPVHPHGLWHWDVALPQQITCTECGEIFPNSRYPENIVLKTNWGKPQTIKFYGGEPFPVFGYKEGRPAFSANIRSRKVQWIAGFSKTLAEGFQLFGNLEYALACRRILLRLAHCYPNWLVHVGYGEYADIDPKIAAMTINNLPRPELCPPPNKPDHSLWTGYWSAGRASGVGLESDFIRKTVAAYDLTCNAGYPDGSPVYSTAEKTAIERDLLLESTLLLVGDKGLNNKSVSNRTAVALVGRCLGHPGLFRFGLEGFKKTVDEWFLPDGATSESPFYGLMTLGGIWDMAQASLGYSDPAGFRDNEGTRMDDLNLYRDTNYHRVWEAFFNGLQGDLAYPPYADSFTTTGLDVAYVELMVANYPEKASYRSLLKALCTPTLSLHSGSPLFTNSFNTTTVDPVLTLPYDLTKPNGSSSFSLYYRIPGLERRADDALNLPDWCPPHLRIGHLRSGKDGRESLLLLSASHWGIHHEQDSLNLYYWKKGKELLSDLGYLWDHPKKSQNIRTLAHNTVVLNEKDQIKAGRGGEPVHYKVFEKIKIMEMASSAYVEVSTYKRTSVLVDHGNGHNYAVDFFRVAGGEIQDYVFHATGEIHEINGIPTSSWKESSIYDFSEVKTAEGNHVWVTKWKAGADLTVAAWSVGQLGERVFLANGWGQRDWKNADIGATIPYIVRRTKGKGLKTFMSVFEGFEGNLPFVKNVTCLEGSGIIAIDTLDGRDYIMSCDDSGALAFETAKGIQVLTGHFAAASVRNDQLVWMESID